VGPANALVDPDQPGHQELGEQTATQVYALESHNSADYVIDVFEGQTGNGARLSTWKQGLDSAASVAAPQRNQSWEFAPRADNPGGKITTGYGALRDRNSGRCLDVVGGSDAVNNGPVSIWDCHGGENQQWTAVSNGAGDYYLKTAQMSNGKSFYLTRSPGGPCVLGHGNTIGATTEPVASCSGWKVPRMSYFFATNKVSTQGGLIQQWPDPAAYNCLPSYQFRVLNAYGESYPYVTLVVANAGDSANPYATQSKDNNRSGPASVFYDYHLTLPFMRTGQVYLYCDPV
jgi:hypothetical protein